MRAESTANAGSAPQSPGGEKVDVITAGGLRLSQTRRSNAWRLVRAGKARWKGDSDLQIIAAALDRTHSKSESPWAWTNRRTAFYADEKRRIRLPERLVVKHRLGKNGSDGHYTVSRDEGAFLIEIGAVELRDSEWWLRWCPGNWKFHRGRTNRVKSR